jgi:pimeloyl-ACP methyl ester carboxylesterase
MGGAVSLLCAINNPDQVDRLILVDSAAFSDADQRGRQLVSPLLLKPVVGPILGALALTSDTLVRRGLETSFYDKRLLTPERVEAYYRPLRTRSGQRAAQAAARQWDLSSVEAGLNRVQQPTLIIWGAEDEMIPLEQGRRLHQKIKDSKMVVFENCGHVPQEEQPKRFIEEVNKFLLK